MVRPASEPASAAPRNELLAWGLLLAAFSPVLVDLVQHLASEPWSLYPVAFWALLVRETRRSPAGERRPRLGWALLGVGLLLELLMLRAGWPRMARPGLVAAAFGLMLLLGRPAPRTATLLLWCIPVPYTLLTLGHPYGVIAQAGVPVWIARQMGAVASLDLLRGNHVEAVIGAQTLPLEPPAAGLPLVAVLAGVAWSVGLARGEPLGRVLLRSARGALVAIPVQLAVVATAVAATALGSARVGLLCIEASVPVATVVGLAWAWRRAPDPRRIGTR